VSLVCWRKGREARLAGADRGKHPVPRPGTREAVVGLVCEVVWYVAGSVRGNSSWLVLQVSLREAGPHRGQGK
jgi:hypothetical protein